MIQCVIWLYVCTSYVCCISHAVTKTIGFCLVSTVKLWRCHFMFIVVNLLECRKNSKKLNKKLKVCHGTNKSVATDMEL